MEIFDVHTHNPNAANAIISRNVWEFAPIDGRAYSVGIHPWYSDRDGLDSEFEKLQSIATLSSVLAIGECGMDALRGSTIENQAELTRKHILLAESVGKPLILHCVRTGNQLIQLHRQMRPRQPWIIHGFRGTSGLALSLLACPGVYLSFGEHFNPQALEVTPVSRILVETDESATPISEIAAKVTAAKGCRPEDLYASRLFHG